MFTRDQIVYWYIRSFDYVRVMRQFVIYGAELCRRSLPWYCETGRVWVALLLRGGIRYRYSLDWTIFTAEVSSECGRVWVDLVVQMGYPSDLVRCGQSDFESGSGWAKRWRRDTVPSWPVTLPRTIGDLEDKMRGTLAFRIDQYIQWTKSNA